MQQQRHSLTVEIDDLEIFGANSQSVILVVRGYELVVVATHWESVRNAMLMCEKFSPFEVSGGAARAGATRLWRSRLRCERGAKAHYGLPGTGGWGPHT